MSPPPPPPGRREIWALYAGTVAAYADMYLTQPILPLLSEEFGVGPARAGLTVSAVVLAIDTAHATATWGHIGDTRLYCFRRQRIIGGQQNRAGQLVVAHGVDLDRLHPRLARIGIDFSGMGVEDGCGEQGAGQGGQQAQAPMG